MNEKGQIKYPPKLVIDAICLVAFAISKACWFIRFHGRENIPPKTDGCFLIAANHQTYIDPVWICLPIRRRLRFMAFDKAFNWPVIGKIIRYLGAFPVSSEDGITISDIKNTLRSIRDGAILTIFPEGAREFADGQMLDFKNGAVRIAMLAGVPILPVTIAGGNRIWPRPQRYPSLFRRVDVTYHPLMHFDLDSRSPQALDELTVQLRTQIGRPQSPLNY